MHFLILRLAVSYFRNPLRGIKALAIIKEKRNKIQGLGQVSRFISSGNRYFFADNIPGWPSKAFTNQFRSEIRRTIPESFGKIPPTTIFIAITSRCPLRCTHCYEWENLSQKETLSIEQLRLIVGKVKDYGISHIQLSGGEPLMRVDDLTELIRLSAGSADVWINTSGFGLTREIARKLKEAGLTGAEISLDHWNELDHNAFRGHPESFSWVREAAKNCLQEGILTSLSLCATPDFVTKVNLERYTELALGWGVSFLRLLEVRKTSRFKGKESKLSSEHISLLEEFYLDSQSSGKDPNYPIIAYPGYHQRRTGCMGAGNRYFYIDPKGDIHACPFCRGVTGNAITDTLEDTIRTLKKKGCHVFQSNPEG
ncbi:MAG: radical SAM protein [Bacteroidales bacterium]|nr:radical SAM protein [Bacteroidales bacterium]